MNFNDCHQTRWHYAPEIVSWTHILVSNKEEEGALDLKLKAVGMR